MPQLEPLDSRFPVAGSRRCRPGWHISQFREGHPGPDSSTCLQPLPTIHLSSGFDPVARAQLSCSHPCRVNDMSHSIKLAAQSSQFSNTGKVELPLAAPPFAIFEGWEHRDYPWASLDRKQPQSGERMPPTPSGVGCQFPNDKQFRRSERPAAEFLQSFLTSFSEG